MSTQSLSTKVVTNIIFINAIQKFTNREEGKLEREKKKNQIEIHRNRERERERNSKSFTL
jgi:hypothetical protein